MPKQKYYYAVVIKDGEIASRNGCLIICNRKDMAEAYISMFYKHGKVAPISVNELHKLIQSHTNKKAR